LLFFLLFGLALATPTTKRIVTITITKINPKTTTSHFHIRLSFALKEGNNLKDRLFLLLAFVCLL
jgi:hypothetical protein